MLNSVHKRLKVLLGLGPKSYQWPLRLCGDIASGGGKQAFPFVVAEPEAERAPERSGHVMENLPKLLKMVGGSLKRIQRIQTG